MADPLAPAPSRLKAKLLHHHAIGSVRELCGSLGTGGSSRQTVNPKVRNSLTNGVKASCIESFLIRIQTPCEDPRRVNRPKPPLTFDFSQGKELSSPEAPFAVGQTQTRPYSAVRLSFPFKGGVLA